MNGIYIVGDTVFDNWKLVRLLGEGSFGKVFEARRVDFGVTYKSAIKIMTIPQSQSEVLSVKAEGLDEASVTSYFHGMVEEMVQEFVLMSKLQGTANVVSYLDHIVIEHTGSIGWDILIRMELLTPMTQYLGEHVLSRDDIVKVGIDMCRALELCERFQIIHRDIKPANMFVSEIGDYKLGDFGIARTMERSFGVMSQKGTYNYMAPEIFRNDPYGSNVDIYSLGIVLYYLLNHNRAPFLPEAPKPIRPRDRELALKRRMMGDKMPRPAEADPKLAEIVLKACAFSPKERYDNAEHMRQDLEALSNRYGESNGPNRGNIMVQKEPVSKDIRGQGAGPVNPGDPKATQKEKGGELDEEILAAGIDIREHMVYVSGFIKGNAKVLVSFPIKYSDKREVLLDTDQFNDLIDTLMTRLFEMYDTATIKLILCVPNNLEHQELEQIQNNAKVNRLAFKKLVYETDAIAYAAMYRGVVGNSGRFLVGSVVDGLRAVAAYTTAGNDLLCGQTCSVAGEEEPLQIDRIADAEKLILAGEQMDCEELSEMIRVGAGPQFFSRKENNVVRYHNWVTIGMGLLAGEIAGKQTKIKLIKKEM